MLKLCPNPLGLQLRAGPSFYQRTLDDKLAKPTQACRIAINIYGG